MPGQKKIRVSRGSGLKKDEMLRSKYFCQVTRNQMLDVVMEISAPPRPDIKRPPLRYVLVIDVSSSMKYKVGKSTESLLDRVKVFAELVIRKVANKDSLGIVSFAKNVKIEFPVTIMSNDAKVRALGVVRELTVRGGTNLELGMMTGLEVLKDSQSAENKDLIVIFTDGEANKGSTDATEMIANYNEAQAKSGNSACVPISAFTIGGYVPALLDELSQHLGSDAFYWLNENEEFESDMLMPILLREETHVTDVKIKMTCLEGVTFDVDATYKTAAMDLTKDELNYFIHSFPQATMKQIPLKFNLPPESSALDQRPVLDIEITYIDDKMMNRIMKESVLLSSAVLSNVLGASQINQPRGPFGILDSVSAYSVKNNAIDTSLKAANAALVSVAEAKCRVESMVAMEKIAKSITNGEEPSEREEVVRKALSEIAHVRDEYSSIYKRMGNRKSTGQLANSANEWKDKIEFGATLNNKKALGRLFAMSSSIKNQMPAAKGVFSASQKRPFLPNKVEKKLHQYEKILAVTKEKKRREKARAKEPKKQSITKVFKTQNVLLSESLRDKKVGAKRETLSELVVKCGGRPVPNVNTVRTDTFLLCSDKDFKRDSMLVRDAKRAKIPIVREQYIHDCIAKKEMLDHKSYLFAA